MKNLQSAARIVSALAMVSAPAAHATPNETPWYKVSQIDGGWTNPNLLVQVNGTYYNPESCVWNGYMIDPATPAYQLFQSMVLSAFMAGKEVSFTIDGCSTNWAKVISVKVR